MNATPFLLLLLAAGAPCAPGAADYRELRDLDLGLFRCAPNPRAVVISSATQLQENLGDMAMHCAPQESTSARIGLEDGLRAAGIDWTRESLVVLGDWYGTGMARGKLDLTISEPGTLSVSVRWSVPPPPLTPDISVFFGAVAVDRTRVRKLSIGGRDPTTVMLPRPP